MGKIPSPFVSVIVPVYNDPARLKTCLQALEEQTYPKDGYEVIVVDNGSDESIEPVVAHFPQAKAAYEAHPGSYAARNTGIAGAKGDVLAFTDSDCIPASNWIESGVAVLLRVPNCGIIGGQLVPSFEKPEHPTAIELYEVIMYYCQERFVNGVKFSVTANLFTFKHIFEHVGNFKSTLKSGGDREWGQRVAPFGYQFMCAGEVVEITGVIIGAFAFFDRKRHETSVFPGKTVPLNPYSAARLVFRDTLDLFERGFRTFLALRTNETGMVQGSQPECPKNQQFPEYSELCRKSGPPAISLSERW